MLDNFNISKMSFPFPPKNSMKIDKVAWAGPSDHRIELAPGLWTVIMAFVGEAATWLRSSGELEGIRWKVWARWKLLNLQRIHVSSIIW
jgi:hypothetical protein